MVFALTPVPGSPSRLGCILAGEKRSVWWLCLACTLLLGPAVSQGEETRDSLDGVPADLGAALPADAIYPRGRKFVMMRMKPRIVTQGMPTGRRPASVFSHHSRAWACSRARELCA